MRRDREEGSCRRHFQSANETRYAACTSAAATTRRPSTRCSTRRWSATSPMSSTASRMLRRQKPGLPVCLTVTHLDSLVLARCGFNHSVDYRAAMCFGNAHFVDDPKEKERALDSMVDRFYPGRAKLLRTSSK